MAKPLVLSLDGHEFPVNLVKIDRERLYGAVEIEAVDEKGKPAEIKVLAPDGKTLIEKGGTALATVTEDGSSVERSQLIAVDAEGEPVEPVPSSFAGPNVLASAKTDDYLSQIVKSVYAVEPADGQPLDFLRDHLDSGQMYSFPFSYRGGLEYDERLCGRRREGCFHGRRQAGGDAAVREIKSGRHSRPRRGKRDLGRRTRFRITLT